MRVDASALTAPAGRRQEVHAIAAEVIGPTGGRQNLAHAAAIGSESLAEALGQLDDALVLGGAERRSALSTCTRELVGLSAGTEGGHLKSFKLEIMPTHLVDAKKESL